MSILGRTVRAQKRRTGGLIRAHATKNDADGEFMAWADKAARKRDESLVGAFAFEELVAWLEQGRGWKQKIKASDVEDS